LELLLVTAPAKVFTAAVSVVVVAIGLVTAGVAVEAGVGWALITSGALTGISAVCGAAVLLRDEQGST
jgi:hypothetical protein